MGKLKKFKFDIETKYPSKSDPQKEGKKSPTKSTLQTIFHADGDDQVDMTRLDRKKRSSIIKFIIIGIILLALLATASVVGFFAFARDQQKTRGENSAALTITSDSEASSGQLVMITATYVNNDKASLIGTRLEMHYPQGFIFESADPKPLEGSKNVWDLGVITSGAAGQIKISGQIIGEIQSVKNFSGSLTYKLSNFNYSFEKKGAKAIKIKDSIINIEIDGPLKATDLQSLTYTIKYGNNANFGIKNLRVIAEYPSGFAFKSSDPKTVAENQVWDIEEVASQTQGEIRVTGSLGGEVNESKEIKAQIGFMDENREFNLQKEASMITLMVKPEMSIGLDINDCDKDCIANANDTLRYHLVYENISDLELQDVELELRIKTGEYNPNINEIVRWDGLDSQYKDIRKDGIIHWTKEQKGELASVKPHQKGDIIFEIKVKDTIQLKQNHQNLQIINELSIPKFKLEGYESNAIKMQEQSVILKINSLLQLQTEGRYFTEEYEPVGSGPIPPEIGKTTTYRIYWYVSNSFNEATNVIVKTILPKDVFWVGDAKASAGDAVTFDTNTREVAWKLNKIPAHTGTIFSNLEAYFTVSITPTKEQLGKLVALTDDSSISGDDSFTKTKLEDTNSIVTTDLTNDVAAKGRGMVIEASVNTNTNTNTNSNTQE